MGKNPILAAQTRLEKARTALESGDRNTAWDLCHQVCTDLIPENGLMPESDLMAETGLMPEKGPIPEKAADQGRALFISACLNLSQLGFILGTNFHELTLFLSRALEKAQALGDRRSGAMIHLHLGRLYYFSQRRLEAFDAFEKGAKEVQDLGDEDILVRSAEFIGLHYFTQGRLKKALHHFELGLYFAGGGLSYYYFDQGQNQTAYDKTEAVMNKARETGLRWQYASPIFLEMIYTLYRAGLPPLAGIKIEDETQRLLNEPNILLRGVALRLRALVRIEEEGKFSEGKKDLALSLDYLRKSNASIQLAKTRIELARLSLIEEDTKKARLYANQAARGLGSYTKEFYPDDLLYLLRTPVAAAQKRGSSAAANPGRALLGKFMDVIRMLEPATDLDTILDRVVKAVNHLLGAERGGVIWFENTGPKLRASHNLTKADLGADDFRSNLATIFEVHRTGQSRLIHNEKGKKKDWPYQCRALLCIPIKIRNEATGVLYYDNSYVDDCFEMLDIDNLDEIAIQLSGFIERLFLLFTKIKTLETESHEAAPPLKSRKIITQSPAMETLLVQTGQVAHTDSSVLILGETGVGKELLARHIHTKSNRVNKPFIVIDPSTMPEGLVESELFGHEKGAFTGADRQRKGRLEMAHHGTLFIDEIGDIPLSVQVKLLRTLQEKTITRVGGTTELSTDFRLVAATHRDLAKMVASGTFREDLYYRINVVPLYIPPLRERQEDVTMLARYFLREYGAKYHKKDIDLSKTNESVLTAYHWPGNIRELKNVMERTVLLSPDDNLTFNLPKTMSNGPAGPNPFDDLPTMEEIQKRYIIHVLEKT
jgi:transcriptional regulator with GAF, ATPase, and Fis domain/tetratricopeptide (TPR) repeat protein